MSVKNDIAGMIIVMVYAQVALDDRQTGPFTAVSCIKGANVVVAACRSMILNEVAIEIRTGRGCLGAPPM